MQNIGKPWIYLYFFFPITIEELSNRAFKNRKCIIKKAMISFKGSEGGMETRRSW